MAAAKEPEVRASLEALGKLTPLLNSITDKANESVASLEGWLNKLGVGVDAQVQVDDGMTLCYGRLQSGFRIYVHFDEGEHGQVMPWVSCDRETKLKTIQQLPKLLKIITDAIEKQANHATSAIADVEHILQKLGKPKTPSPDAYAGDDEDGPPSGPAPTGGNEEIPF